MVEKEIISEVITIPQGTVAGTRYSKIINLIGKERVTHIAIYDNPNSTNYRIGFRSGKQGKTLIEPVNREYWASERSVPKSDQFTRFEEPVVADSITVDVVPMDDITSDTEFDLLLITERDEG